MPIERDNRNVNDAIDEIVSEVNVELEAIQDDIADASLKIYLATFSQTGTSNPVVNVLKNTTGKTLTWTREGVGSYSAPLDVTPYISGSTNWTGASTMLYVPRYNGTNDGSIVIYYYQQKIFLDCIRVDNSAYVEYSTMLGTSDLDLPPIFIA